MECNQKFIEYMHDYLDDDLTSEQEMELRSHLKLCSDCQMHFHELKKSIALVQSPSHLVAPFDFTKNVMKRLPQEKKVVQVKRWLKIHPLFTAAAVFVILMLGSIASIWSDDQELTVSKQANIRIEDNIVIVPSGVIVEGDLIVRNGDLNIEGEVRGDVTVINGKNFLASAGNVTGDIYEINQIFDWIWYNIKTSLKETLTLLNNSDDK